MSRIGKKPITLPAKTTVTVSAENIVSIKGPLGELTRQFPKTIKVEVVDGTVTVSKLSNAREVHPLWGTVAAHIKNMVLGVNTAYVKKLIIEGVGYKADAQGTVVNMALGLSHPVKVPVPKGIAVKTEKAEITITGIDKEAVGAFAAYIRSLKVPEPYKGKGIRYVGEIIKRKQGKKAA